VDFVVTYFDVFQSERSSLVNAARLAKVKRRNEVVEKVKESARDKLATASSNPKYGELLRALIVQGLIRLKEVEVTIRVRQEDEALVQSILKAAEADYKRVMKRDTTLDVDVHLKIDTSEYLPPGPKKGVAGFSCAGGVVLVCSKGRIVLDNTLDRRLDLAFQELKPTIRKSIFG
jgi:V-type H+-transporting ATPase subunit E